MGHSIILECHSREGGNPAALKFLLEMHISLRRLRKRTAIAIQIGIATPLDSRLRGNDGK
jgi:hypothetical protein